MGQWQVQRGRRAALRGCRSLVGHCVARCVSARHQNPQKKSFPKMEKIIRRPERGPGEINGSEGRKKGLTAGVEKVKLQPVMALKMD